MANQVFDSALAAITQAMGAIEAEVQRLSGVQQHLDALQTQRRDLQVTVNQLAQKIPEHKQSIADAESMAKTIVEGARIEKARIVAEAEHNASALIAEAHNQAKSIVDAAKAAAETFEARVAQAKEDLDGIRDKIKVANSQVDAARNTFARLKQHAGAFAQLESD